MRNPTPSRSGRAKITMEIAEAIRHKALEGKLNYRMLGAAYGLTAQSVGKIIRRETWIGDDPYIPDDEPMPTERETLDNMTPAEQARANASLAKFLDKYPEYKAQEIVNDFTKPENERK